MLIDLVEDPEQKGAYYKVRISKDNTCYLPDIGKCRVIRDVFAYTVFEILKSSKEEGKC